MTGFSEDLQDISDVQKTVVIKNDLKRLNVDIVTLQGNMLSRHGHTQRE